METELRVALNESQATKLLKDLDIRGANWRYVRRLMIDLSAGELSDRQRTVMVRANDGAVELVVKSGGTADTERQECAIKTRGSISEALNTAALLGYKKGSCGLRSIQKCEIDGIEYSLRTVHNLSKPGEIVDYNFEVELIDVGAVEDLETALGSLGLSPLTKQETIAWFTRLHAEANIDYVHSEQALVQIEQILNDK